MNKRFIKAGILFAVILVGFKVWVATGRELFDNFVGWPFNYYKDFNIAKRAVEKSGCVKSFRYGLHKDFRLESVRFFIHTKSGWKVRLRFIFEMDAGQVCEDPKGLLVDHPRKGWQVYTREYLKEKGLRLRDIRDALCKFDELAAIFEANYENEDIPVIDRLEGEFLGYIVFESVPWNTKSMEAAREQRPFQTPDRRVAKPGELQSVEFDVVSVDSIGTVISRDKHKARSYLELIDDGVAIEMVEIPGGTFLMGNSDAQSEQVLGEYHRLLGDNFANWCVEDVKAQSPQRLVTVSKFFMGAYEVTQAQWRAVASLPKVSRDLAADPSRFKGDDLPVDSVSWEDAMEFCGRLSRATGKEYRLPTEAEWEYACRAGTTTPFHFGTTITPDLANFGGTRPYGSAKWGIARHETTPVGVFGVANAFGLYDMHGNVAEWCLDPWHGNYSGAPVDGSVWIADGDNRYHAVRGGAWVTAALYCSATNRLMTNVARDDYGLRIVAVAR